MGREVLVQGAQDLPMEDEAGKVLLFMWKGKSKRLKEDRSKLITQPF